MSVNIRMRKGEVKDIGGILVREERGRAKREVGPHMEKVQKVRAFDHGPIRY